MPYIQISTTKKMERQQKEKMKQELGNAISLISGKSEDVLMIGFLDGTDLYYQGKHKKNAAYVQVSLHTAALFDEKKQFVSEVFRIFEEILKTPSEDIFITMPEYPNWGVGGKLL